jgi:hypothetical protein
MLSFAVVSRCRGNSRTFNSWLMASATFHSRDVSSRNAEQPVYLIVCQVQRGLQQRDKGR